MSDVLFTGKFDLDDALQEFGRFATAVEERMKRLANTASGTNQQGGKSKAVKDAEEDINKIRGLKIQAEKQERARESAAAQQALKDRAAVYSKEKALIQKITDQQLNQNVAQAQKETKVLAKMRADEFARQEKEKKEEAKRQQKIVDDQLAYNIRMAKKNTKEQLAEEKRLTTEQEKEARDANRRFEKLFAGFTVGGFALQRFGQFLTENITAPLKQAATEIINVVIAVDDFEQTLKTRGGKTADEIEEIYQVVKKVSDLPNLERSDVLTIFTRIVEITQGGITARELEKIGGGLSKITTTLESGEKRAFYGQLQDILGGGDVANLEKTLSLVPLLKQKFDELKVAATIDGSSGDTKILILKALEDLEGLPSIDNLATSFKRIRNEIFELQRRLGNLYKDELKALVDFVLNNVVPAINALLTSFENASPKVQNLALIIAGFAAAIPPLLSVLGAFGIAIGGIGFALAEFQLAFGSFASIGASLGISGGGLAGVFAPLLSMLPRLLTLLNPVALLITGLVAILTKAFADDAGGFGTALTFLAGTILPTIWNLLKNIFATVSALYDAVASIYNLIDVGGILTTVIGTLGTGIAYILATLIQLVNLLAFIPASLQFIADIFSGNIDLAFERFYNTLLKVIQSITVLGTLVEAVFGIDLQALIEKSEQEIKSLDKASQAMNKNAQRDAETTAEKQRRLTQAYKENQQSIASITQLIKAQTKAIEDNTYKARLGAQERAQNTRREIAQLAISNYGQQDFDLSSEQGIASARAGLSSANVEVETAARQDRNLRIQKALRDKLKEQRDEFLKLAEKEVDANVKKVYEQYAILLKQSIEDNIELTPDVFNKTVYDVLVRTISKSPLQGTQLKLLIDQLTNEKFIIKQVYDTQIENIEEITKAQGEARQREAALERQIQQQIQKDRITSLSSPFLLSNDIQDANIRLAKEGVFRNLELAKNTLDVVEALKTVTKYETELRKAEEKRRDNLLALDRLQIKSQSEHIAAQDKINKDYDINKIETEWEIKKAKSALIQSITKEQFDQYEEWNKLQSMLLDRLTIAFDLAVQLEALGIKTSDKLVENINATIDVIYRTTVSVSLQKLQKAASVLGDKQQGVLKNIFDSFKTLTDKDLIDPAVRNKMMEQSEDMVDMFQTLIRDDKKVLSPEDKLQMQIILDQYIALLNTIKENEGLLNQKVNIDLKNLQVKELQLEREQDINDVIADQLELEKQILEIRSERGYIKDLKNYSDIFKDILNTISGSRKAIYEADKKILENQKIATQLELDIAIKRLEIEQAILILKMRAAGASEEEIAQTKELFEQQIEQLKKKGELQQELIDEQLASLNRFGGGILDIFFGIISDAIGKKKKEKEEDEGTVSPVDEDGNEIPWDENAEGAEEVGNATDKMAEKMAKAQKIDGALGKALTDLDEITTKSLLKALAAELKALQQKATIKALEYAAEAISAAVFGDWNKAAKAGAAAAAWTGVALAAGAASKYLTNKADGDSAANSQASKERAAGATETERQKELLKQKALSVFINLDIRTDDGIIIKKNIAALNQNTELTTLTMNSQEGWYYPPAP